MFHFPKFYSLIFVIKLFHGKNFVFYHYFFLVSLCVYACTACNLLPLKSTPRSQLVRRSFQASTRSRPQSAILENSTTLNQKGLTNQSVSLRQSFSPVLVHSHQKKKSSSLSNSSEMTKSQLTLNRYEFMCTRKLLYCYIYLVECSKKISMALL